MAAPCRGRGGAPDQPPSNRDDVVLGGGNVKNLKELPKGSRAGNNDNAFLGGFRLWEKAVGQRRTPAPKLGTQRSESIAGSKWRQAPRALPLRRPVRRLELWNGGITTTDCWNNNGVMECWNVGNWLQSSACHSLCYGYSSTPIFDSSNSSMIPSFHCSNIPAV